MQIAAIDKNAAAPNINSIREGGHHQLIDFKVKQGVMIASYLHLIPNIANHSFNPINHNMASANFNWRIGICRGHRSYIAWIDQDNSLQARRTSLIDPNMIKGIVSTHNN